jgi:predicted transcriptional regulator
VSGRFNERRPHLSIYIRCNGTPEKAIIQFLRDIESWFTKRGVKGIVRQNTGYEIKGMVQWQLEFFSKEATSWFRQRIEMFAKSEIRARLFVMSAAENDAVLYEALRELHAPVNVVLGLIVEQPLTHQQIKQTLQMQAQGVRNSIQCLVRKGLIVKEQEKYRYEPTAYVTRLIHQKRARTAKLCRQMQVFREKLLFQCQSCGRVYTKERTICGRCGSEVQPVERRKVLRPITTNSVLLSSTEQKLVQQINQKKELS